MLAPGADSVTVRSSQVGLLQKVPANCRFLAEKLRPAITFRHAKKMLRPLDSGWHRATRTGFGPAKEALRHPMSDVWVSGAIAMMCV